MSHDNAENHFDETPYHGTYRSYIIGFVLSVILTAIPFALVMNDVIDNKLLNALALLGFAAVQMVVHMVYFLHMNSKSEDGWNMLAFGFTLIVVVIALSGSIWVMHHLNTNMMPDHEMEASF
ncbi:MAG: cytochrome o ubiquinol oxidase subunit IV [Alphaproteobacteria bacterium]|nr:cytochrome o ubiquinol oxidase subunit IV [Alphaproteobacteria bacterium]